MKLHVLAFLLGATVFQCPAFTAASFSPHVDFAAISGQVGVAFGDLDGDGKPDAVAANYSGGTISVYRNTSVTGAVTASSFAAPVTFTVGSTPVLVRLADLDGDGKLDLVVVNQGNDTLSILRNTSTIGVINSASFAPRIDLATPGDPRWVAIADFDGDGKPDLASATFGSGLVSLFQNNSAVGSIAFGARQDITPPSSSPTIEAGDVDGDGKADLVTSYAYLPSVAIYRNIHGGGAISAASFAAPVDFAAGHGASVTLSDVDGDGKLDIVTANASDNTLSVLRNTSFAGVIATNSFAPVVTFSTGGYPYNAVVADLDGDGRPDVIVSDADSHTVSVFRNVGAVGSITATSLLARVAYATGHGPRVCSAVDVDGDGLLDLATPNLSQGSFSILRNTGTNGAPPNPPSLTGDFDLSHDFSAVNNPSGAWSYGWKASAGGSFGLSTQPAAATSDNGVLIHGWVLAGYGQPAVYANDSLGTGVGAGGQFIMPPGAVWVHPGLNGRPENFGTVRFTAPSNSNYRVQTAVSSIYSGYLSHDNEFRVAVNGVEVFGQFLPPLTGTSWSNVIALNAGATVDFLVGRGADGNEYGSALKLAAYISATTSPGLVITNQPPQPPVAQGDFNLARDFSAVSNPAGAWRYGWKNSLAGSFTTDPFSFSATSDNGVSIAGWAANHTIGLPAHYCNTTATTAIIGSGQGVLPPGTFWMHPGETGYPENFGAVRFIAPSNSNYRVETTADSLYTGYLSGDTDYHVVVNGVEVFGQPLPAKAGTAWTNVVTLHAGDTVDFALGRGADGISYGAGLRVAAIITPTTNAAVTMTNEPPQPPVVVVYSDFNLSRDFSSTVNPSGAWRYGWKNSLGGEFAMDPFYFGVTSDNGRPIAGWAANHTYGLPAHYCNTSGNTAIIGGGQGVLPAGTFWMHPGASGQPENFGAVRFTAPSNANYRVETTADALYSGNLSGDTDYHVVVNGIEVFSQPLPANAGTAWTNVVALNAGDTIDFALGRGADGNEYGAGLKVAAIITPTADVPIVITNPPPAPVVIVSQPLTYQSVNAGAMLTLNVTASGQSPLAYQWQRGGTDIFGATAASLTLSNVQVADAGNYRVVVTNSVNAVTSAVAVVNVLSVQSGGSLVFANNSTNQIYDVGGSSFAPAGGSLVIGLFAGTNASSLQQIGGVATFLAPGRFSAGLRTVPGTGNGQTVSAQIKVWDSAFGSTYETASAAGGKRGASPVFQVTLAGGIQPPPILGTMPSFALTLPGIAAAQFRSLPVAPVSLHQMMRTAKGWAFMVSGPTGATCAIETSTNLTDWTTVAYVVNQTGAVEYVHKDTSAAKRFFRVRVVNP